MWIDTSQCTEYGVHEFVKDEEGKWIVVHADDSICTQVEWGGSDVAEVLAA